MFEIIATLIIAILIITVIYFYKKTQELFEIIERIKFEKRSQSVRYGKLTEQYIPFTEEFPFDSENFRFIGNPIDGIAFEENEIIFCEFKASDSKLNEKQRKIKKLVEDKKIRWFEFNMR
ncbi:MAG: endonuclease [Candidatus Diapherotrites archaeon]|nr:endonuclease [Candidatus Diapherotrites archaeon]